MAINSATDHGFERPIPQCRACGSMLLNCCDGQGNPLGEETVDVFEGSHAEFAASESYVSPGEKAWLAWSAKVEKLLGHSLDGNEATDGYSVDGAMEAHEGGLSPIDYAAWVMVQPNYKPRA